MANFNNFNHNSLNCPCRDCKKRNATCHSACQKYKDWRLMLDERARKGVKTWILK